MKIPYWSNLQGLGTSKAVNSSLIWLIVIPFVARVIDAVDTRYHVDLSLPFNALMLYCAAFSFSIAAVIFLIFCPTLVSKAPNFGAFTSAGHSGTDLKKWFREVANSPDKKSEASSELIFRFMKAGGRPDNLPAGLMPDVLTGIASSQLMQSYWLQPLPPLYLPDAYDVALNHADQLGPWARGAATFFYAVGFVAIAAVAIYNFHSVYLHFMNHPHF